jgi:carboxymethylenebutenolidase
MADKPALDEQTISLNGQAGELPTFIAHPNDGKKYPGVIVVHEIFGLNDHIRSVARRLAQESMTVYAPCLFAHAKPSNQDDLAVMREIWSKIPDSQLIADLQTVMAEMKKSEFVKADSIGTIGFCMGGAIAYMFACETPDIAWVADFYGRLFYPQLTEAKAKHPIDFTPGLPGPVLGIFAGIDDLITHEHIMLFRKALLDHKKEADVHIFDDAHHAFFNDEREFYHAQAAEESWKLTLSFIDRVTKAPTSS